MKTLKNTFFYTCILLLFLTISLSLFNPNKLNLEVYFSTGNYTPDETLDYLISLGDENVFCINNEQYYCSSRYFLESSTYDNIFFSLSNTKRYSLSNLFENRAPYTLSMQFPSEIEQNIEQSLTDGGFEIYSISQIHTNNTLTYLFMLVLFLILLIHLIIFIYTILKSLKKIGIYKIEGFSDQEIKTLFLSNEKIITTHIFVIFISLTLFQLAVFNLNIKSLVFIITLSIFSIATYNFLFFQFKTKIIIKHLQNINWIVKFLFDSKLHKESCCYFSN